MPNHENVTSTKSVGVLIKVLVMARNGWPNMIGICLHSLVIDIVSKMITTSKRLLEVFFNSPRLSCWYTKYGSKLTLALRS